MKYLIALAALVAVACAAQISEQRVKQEWQTFKARHGKTYASPVEEEHRMKIFKDNLVRVEEHNEKYEQGLETFTVAINHLSDLHLSEIRERLNGLRMDPAARARLAHRGRSAPPKLGWHWWCLWWCEDDSDDDFVPDPDNSTVDWRTSNIVTPVKDQGQCGSCWSFSTTGALEAQLALKTGNLVSLSEQNLMDCSWSYGNQGCNGGLMTDAFQYVQDNKGIDTEDSYPYRERASRNCGYKAENSAGANDRYIKVQPTEDHLKAAVTEIGPVAIGINAGLWSFSHYSSGVYYDEECGASLDHGVLAVGYGNEDGHAFWIVKNSWGPNWGEEGYVRMARNRNNHCGIANMASYPVVEKK